MHYGILLLKSGLREEFRSDYFIDDSGQVRVRVFWRLCNFFWIGAQNEKFSNQKKILKGFSLFRFQNSIANFIIQKVVKITPSFNSIWPLFFEYLNKSSIFLPILLIFTPFTCFNKYFEFEAIFKHFHDFFRNSINYQKVTNNFDVIPRISTTFWTKHIF